MAKLTPAILVLGPGALATAQRIQAGLPGAAIHGFAGRIVAAGNTFEDFTAAISTLYRTGTPIIALCATGIIIRALAPLLSEKMAEPPVLCVAEDGSTVVPLLGATTGANTLARRIGDILGSAPAITTSGELRFGVNLLAPQPGYQLLNPEAGKRFVADLLAGAPVAFDGTAPWLERASFTRDADARHRIAIVDTAREPQPDELVFLRTNQRGRLAVVGLGPGDHASRTPAVSSELAAADDILGYAPYVAMAGPFRPEQNLHPSDNRVELDRSRLALDLAAAGKRVVLVSSGDPGIFAMAAAVFETLDTAADPRWREIDIQVLPGISAAMAAAALAGAPLGHDFAVLSLSDNLKPWEIIEARLNAAAAADFVLALYNPVSRARPHQLAAALATIARHRSPETPVILGRDIGRPGGALLVRTLGTLDPALVDSRTVLIVGSSRTRTLARQGIEPWVYTPRFYRPPETPA